MVACSDRSSPPLHNVKLTKFLLSGMNKCVIRVFEGRAAADVMPGESWTFVVFLK